MGSSSKKAFGCVCRYVSQKGFGCHADNHTVSGCHTKGEYDNQTGEKECKRGNHHSFETTCVLQNLRKKEWKCVHFKYICSIITLVEETNVYLKPPCYIWSLGGWIQSINNDIRVFPFNTVYPNDNRAFSK